MQIEYDPAKNALNIQRRGLSFELALDFDWNTAQVDEDTRHDYGEQRFQATGFIGEHLYRLVFTWRDDKARIISLRRTTKSEEKYYASQSFFG